MLYYPCLISQETLSPITKALLEPYTWEACRKYLVISSYGMTAGDACDSGVSVG